MNLKKIADRLIGIILWWPIAFWRVCNKEARSETVGCVSLCIMVLFAYLVYKGRFTLFIFVIGYILTGIIVSSKFFWKSDPQQEKTLQEIAQ